MSIYLKGVGRRHHDIFNSLCVTTGIYRSSFTFSVLLETCIFLPHWIWRLYFLLQDITFIAAMPPPHSSSQTCSSRQKGLPCSPWAGTVFLCLLTNLMYRLRELACPGFCRLYSWCHSIIFSALLTRMKCTWRDDPTSSRCTEPKVRLSGVCDFEAKLIFRKQIQEEKTRRNNTP